MVTETEAKMPHEAAWGTGYAESTLDIWVGLLATPPETFRNSVLQPLCVSYQMLSIAAI